MNVHPSPLHFGPAYNSTGATLGVLVSLPNSSWIGDPTELAASLLGCILPESEADKGLPHLTELSPESRWHFQLGLEQPLECPTDGIPGPSQHFLGLPACPTGGRT